MENENDVKLLKAKNAALSECMQLAEAINIALLEGLRLTLPESAFVKIEEGLAEIADCEFDQIDARYNERVAA